MKAKFRNTLASVGLILFLLLASPLQTFFSIRARAQQNAPQPVSLKVSTKNNGGAFELTYDTLLYGDLKVYLPDDMAAGDTISGTVVAEPKGSTEEERANNQNKLEGYKFEFDEVGATAQGVMFDTVSGNVKNQIGTSFTGTIPTLKMQPHPRYLIRIIEAASGKEVANTTLPVQPTPSSVARPPTITPNDFRLPTIGQQGRPVEIIGPFDGNSSNTSLNWKAEGSSSQAATGNDSGKIEVLAESPRKSVFMSPRDAKGPVDLTLNEKSVSVKGLFRNVGIGLSVPKTNLLKGESTTLTVLVSGLQDLKQSVPLQLITQGVVQMDGGNTQYFLIPPSLVTQTGTFATTRTLTGQQAGGFTVTATVFVNPLDTCLQDDEDNRALLFNTATGDYIFTEPGVASLGGKGTIMKKGCTLTLTDDRVDRRVQSKLDTCKETGSATVQLSSPKMKFTITDKNMKDNTCAVR